MVTWCRPGITRTGLSRCGALRSGRRCRIIAGFTVVKTACAGQCGAISRMTSRTDVYSTQSNSK